jgi:threonine/homoserine/homoserine lactone efflux protein
MTGFDLPPELFPFLLASLLIELTPGPNMTWLAILAVSEGRWKGLQAVAGVAAGLSLLGFAGALGVTEIITSSRMVYEALRWAGILFLIYLAWEGWQGEGQAENAGDDGHRAFLRGLVSNLLNPKAAIFYVTVLPAFVVPDRPADTQTWVLMAGYVSVATLVHSIIVLLAAQLQPFIAGGGASTSIRRLLSLALLFTALWFGWSTAR